MNPNASVYLLQQLVHRWIDHSILISSTDAMKQFIQQLFMVSLTLLAGEGMPVVLAKDARAIAIWCLMGNVDCWRHWDSVYKAEYKSWKDHSLKLPSSPSDIVILRHTMKSFRLKVMPISRLTSLLISSLIFTCARFLRTKKASLKEERKLLFTKKLTSYAK